MSMTIIQQLRKYLAKTIAHCVHFSVFQRKIKKILNGAVLFPSQSIHFRKGVAWSLTFLIAISGSGVALFLHSGRAEAASYTWTQSNWSGGADGGTYPTHPTNQTNWTKYASKDSGATVGASSVTLTSQADASVQTSDTDFTAGTQNRTAMSGSGASGAEHLDVNGGYSDYWSSTPNGHDYNAGSASAYPGSGNYVYHLDGWGTGFERFDIAHRNWSNLAATPAMVLFGGGLISTQDDYLYAFRGSSNTFWRYSISGDAWVSLAVIPEGSGLGSGLVYPGSGDFIFAQLPSGDFYRYSITGNSWSSKAAAPGSSGGPSGLVSDGTYVYEIAANGTDALWRYSIAGDSWTTLTSAPESISTGGTIVYPGSGDYMYVAVGGGSSNFYRYSISGDSWLLLAIAPIAMHDSTTGVFMGSLNNSLLITTAYISSSTLIYSLTTGKWSPLSTAPGSLNNNATRTTGANGKIYVLASGSSLYEYTVASDTWATLAAPTESGNYADDMYYPGFGNFIYYTPGETNTFYKYSISGNSWSAAASAPSTWFSSTGSTFTSDGTYIYAASSLNHAFYRYSIAGNSWTSLTNMPVNAGNGHSLLYPGSGDAIYFIVGGGTGFYKYSIAGDSWSSALAATPASLWVGAIAAAPGGDSIYLVPDGSANVKIYSIAGDSWSSSLSNMPSGLGIPSGFAYPGTGTELYAASSNDQNLRAYTFTSGYFASGTFTSSDIQLSQNSTFTTLNYNQTLPANTTLKYRIRSASTELGLSSATFYGPTSTADYYTSSGTAINSIHNGDTWLQYRAYFDTSNPAVTPSLNDITFHFTFYAANGSLISSAYNTNEATNLLSKVRWTQTVPTGTTVKFQLRGAADSAGSPGSWGSWMGPDGTDTTYFTSNTGGEATPAALKTGSNVQWFQYQAYLSTNDGTKTPTLSSTTLTYVVNAPPDFNTNYPSVSSTGVAANQNSDGSVTIQYSIRDQDTDTATNTPGFITPSFEYSLNNGVSWSAITSGNLGGSDLSNKAVDTSSFTTYSATWNAKNQLAGTYTTSAKVRVQANDNELANNTIKAASAAFTLDTKNPVVGGTPIQINSGASKVNTRDVTLSLSATDDSSLQDIVSEDSSFTGATYQSYSASTPFTLSTTDGLKTVYVKFKDQYGNVSATQSANITLDTTPPAVPLHLHLDDISSASEGYRLFVTWDKNTESDFSSYQVYRSVDGGAASLYRTITDINTNYVYDPILSASSVYAYTVIAVDDIANASNSSTAVSATPAYNADTTPPGISNIASSSLTATTATITFSTDESAVPSILYSSDSSFTQVGGVATYGTSHSILIIGLTSGTAYNFKAKACDPSGNCTVSSASSFTTTTGDVAPAITAVTSAGITNNQVTITWATDVSATSMVEYSTTSGFTSGTLFGSADLTKNHAVTLPAHLLASTPYYFKVHSVNSQGIEAVSAQYSFVTQSDTAQTSTVAPAISAITTPVISDTGVTVAWLTDTAATSQVEWGLTVSLGTKTDLDTNLSTKHSVSVGGLKANTMYYYKVFSKDSSGNVSVADNNGVPFSLTTQSSISDSSSMTDTQITQLSQQVSAAFLQKFLVGLKDNPNVGEQIFIQAATQAADAIISTPLISGVNAEVVVGTRSAVITWVTNKDANSLVAYAPESSFNGKSSQPYTMAAGSADTMGTSHAVTLTNLEPNTTYHFQLRSQGSLGPVAFSNDATLKTLTVNPTIIDARFVSLSEDTAVVRWETDVPTETTLQTIDTATGQPQVLTDANLIKNHTMTVTDLISSHAYTLQITSKDEGGNTSQSSVIPFSTSTSSAKPVISQVNISSTLVSNSSQSTQTIVTWQTDKPATSQVIYYESGNESSAQHTSVVADLVRSHVVVITSFKPGTVYGIKVQSSDGSSNGATSDPFSVLTPKPTGSVIDLIFKNLNQTFGFLHR